MLKVLFVSESMARHYSASVLRSLKRYGEACLRIEGRYYLPAPNLGAAQRLGVGRGFSTAQTSSGCCNKPIAEFRRLMSACEEIHDTRERVRGKDRLILRGCKFQGYHGVLEEEKKLGQKFVVDMDAWLDLKKAGESDNMEHTVSYAEVFSTVQKVVEGPSRDLLESVANDIACSVFDTHPQITDLRVRICKLTAPIAGFVDKLGVEIYRTSLDFVRKS